MIVIATHHRTGIARVLIGNVAEEVIRSSSVAVLTAKPASIPERFITQDVIISN